MKIAVLVGSLREDSLNKQFVTNLEKIAPSDVELVHVDLHMPLYDDDVLDKGIPAEVATAKSIVEQADGLLFVTPEYNRGVPGVLKNAMDWISRPYGSNSFDQKPAAIAGVSIGPIGTAAAQQQLRSILLYLNTHPMGQPEAYLNASQVFDENGAVAEGSKEFVESYLQAVIAHFERFKKN